MLTFPELNTAWKQGTLYEVLTSEHAFNPDSTSDETLWYICTIYSLQGNAETGSVSRVVARIHLPKGSDYFVGLHDDEIQSRLRLHRSLHVREWEALLDAAKTEEGLPMSHRETILRQWEQQRWCTVLFEQTLRGEIFIDFIRSHTPIFTIEVQLGEEKIIALSTSYADFWLDYTVELPKESQQ